MTKIQLLFGNSMPELIEKMDEFFEGRIIISSPIYQEKNEVKGEVFHSYYCVVYYKSPQEIEGKEVKMATESQIKTLWKTGWNGDPKTLTRKKAFELLKEKFG